MQINKIKLGMELKSLKKKNLFVCEKIDTENNYLEGRMVHKDGTLGKRILKAEASSIVTAQAIFGGCARNGQK